MLLYDVAVASLLIFAALGRDLRGAALWPAVVLHGLMSVWCVACLRRSPVKLKLDSHVLHQSALESGP